MRDLQITNFKMFKNEKIVETKSCRLCSTSFGITDKDMEFYEKVSLAFNSPLTRTLEGEKGAGGISPETSALLNRGIIKDLGDGKIKYLIPTPTLCPDCRQQRRLSFRNERTLYKRKCDLSGKEIISIYSPDKPYTVYDQKIWWSDQWDPLNYGKIFDFGKSFFDQFNELQLVVPKINSRIQDSENCDYTNFMRAGKDNYLAFASSESEKVSYSTWTTRSYDSMDCLYSNTIQNSYRVFQCHQSNMLFYCQYCNNSSYCYNCYGCENCHNCILCSNLSNKSYCYKNKELTKDEYEKILKIYKRDLKYEVIENRIMVPDVISSENSYGGEMYNCKNCKSCFGVNDIEDCSFCFEQFGGQKDCMDCMGSVGTLCYESGISVGSYLGVSVIGSGQCRSVLYSDLCNGCEDCFGCVGLRNKSYCILNKQYTKEAYETLVPRIIEHMMKTPLIKSLSSTGLGRESNGKEQGDFVAEWGEFFPSSISPFGYNETVAQEYFPLTREEVLFNTPPSRGSQRGSDSIHQEISPVTPPNLPSQGRNTQEETFLHGPIFNWSDYEAPFPKVEKSIPAEKLPDDITKIPDDILNWAIECEITKKPFRIIKQELEFYRKHHLPIPHKHPDQRHKERMALRNPRKLYTRHCDKCGKEIQTTYAPERPEIVYCEECYNKEVY